MSARLAPLVCRRRPGGRHAAIEGAAPPPPTGRATRHRAAPPAVVGSAVETVDPRLIDEAVLRAGGAGAWSRLGPPERTAVLAEMLER